MRWRFSKLNWSYGLGELVIVVAGVLIALAVNQWNSDRLDRLEEHEIIERLISDLNWDRNALESQFRSLERKEASLVRVRAVLTTANVPPRDQVEFLRDIVIGANYGWNQEQARRTTFNELLAAGKFGLIRDAQLRVKIAEYYKRDTNYHQRIDERETDYPHISFQLVPRINEGVGGGDVDVVVLESKSADLEQIVDDIFSSPLRNHVTAELNLARFIRYAGGRLQKSCTDLLDELEAYRETIK
jgi:hypothetical protein